MILDAATELGGENGLHADFDEASWELPDLWRPKNVTHSQFSVFPLRHYDMEDQETMENHRVGCTGIHVAMI